MAELGAMGSGRMQQEQFRTETLGAGPVLRSEWALGTEVLQVTPKRLLHSGCCWENRLSQEWQC